MSLTDLTLDILILIIEQVDYDKNAHDCLDHSSALVESSEEFRLPKGTITRGWYASTAGEKLSLTCKKLRQLYTRYILGQHATSVYIRTPYALIDYPTLHFLTDKLKFITFSPLNSLDINDPLWVTDVSRLNVENGSEHFHARHAAPIFKRHVVSISRIIHESNNTVKITLHIHNHWLNFTAIQHIADEAFGDHPCPRNINLLFTGNHKDEKILRSAFEKAFFTPISDHPKSLIESTSAEVTDDLQSMGASGWGGDLKFFNEQNRIFDWVNLRFRARQKSDDIASHV